MPSRLIADGALRPFVLQTVGIGGWIAQGLFWAATSRIEPTLIAACGTLISLGILRDAAKKYVGDSNGRSRGGPDDRAP